MGSKEPQQNQTFTELFNEADFIDFDFSNNNETYEAYAMAMYAGTTTGGEG